MCFSTSLVCLKLDIQCDSAADVELPLRVVLCVSVSPSALTACTLVVGSVVQPWIVAITLYC